MKKRAGKNSESEIISEIFGKKCYELYTDHQIKQYIIDKYFFTPQTAQKYLEKLKHKLAEEVQYDYQKALSQMQEYLTKEIQTTDDKYLKIQYIKELNKINNLGNKQQVDITSGGEKISYSIDFSVIKPKDNDNTDEENKY